MKHKWAIFLLGLFIGFSSCDDEPFDYGYVNFIVQPDDVRYFNLNMGNRGWEYFVGGYSGVVVFRRSAFEFIAFERSCALPDCHGITEVDETNNVLLVCPKCHSKYLYVDGTPLEGSAAKRTLYQYCTYFDGVTLSVYNCPQ